MRDALQSLLTRDESRYRSLFLKSRPLRADAAERPWFETLAAAGYVRPERNGTVSPCVRVFYLGDLLIATDLLAHDTEDQVFSLMLEQAFLFRVLNIRKGEHVLELCLGSGVNSIVATLRGAAKVVGIDINPRALAFASANAAVNLPSRGEGVFEMRLGDMFAPVPADERFDLVLVNPPFEPVPPDTSYFLHSHGGEDGLDFIRVMLPQIPRLLRPGGRFEMYTCVLGDSDSELVSDLVVAAFPGYRVEVRRVDRFPLEEIYQRFDDRPEYGPWRQRLTARGLTYVWGVHVLAFPGEPAGLVLVDAVEDVRVSDAVVSRWNAPG